MLELGFFDTIETFSSDRVTADTDVVSLCDCIEIGMPILSTDNDGRGRLLMPVHRGDDVVSVILMQTRPMLGMQSDRVVGGMEIWQPTGPYEELWLAAGTYGKLERFQNVSSFVRFEKGSGLPGQVWAESSTIIHNDLGSHPGFLRAAGAGADALQTGIGFPVGDAQFMACVVLLSAAETPIADGIEVWTIQDENFVLRETSYVDSVQLPLRQHAGHSISPDIGLVGLAVEQQGAVTSGDGAILNAGLNCKSCWHFGLAIPQFRTGELVEVTNLLFQHK